MKPRLLVISAILPFPLNSGQRVRVYNKLLALRELFHITFLGVAPPAGLDQARAQLAELVDEPVLLPARARQHLAARAWHGAGSHLRALRSGLRASNHLVGDVELSPARIAAHIDPASYDLVLYEYWHTHASTALFRPHAIPCALDMHDLCWRVVERRLRHRPLPAGLRRRRVAAYRQQEEAAWTEYDLLIAINAAEETYVQERLPGRPTLYAPMGIDTAHTWPYAWNPAGPPRIAFYGALGSLGNQQGVFWCLERIMPLVWATLPEAEFWVVGGSPPPEISALASRPQVHVTGYVPDVAATLAQMSLVLCPWQGKFGFRSRVVEVMAVGVPVVATPDAVFGMGLAPGRGLFLHETDEALANQCLALLHDPAELAAQSRLARQQVEETFSFQATYARLAQALRAVVQVSP